jgi:hypothetical protein
MALDTTLINDMLDDIVAAFHKATLLSTVYTAGVGSAVNTGNIVTNPSYIDLVWGSASGGSVTTTNSATNGTALNFSGKGSTTANTLALLLDAGGVMATMQLPASVGFTGKGGGYYITEIEITLEEE